MNNSRRINRPLIVVAFNARTSNIMPALPLLAVAVETGGAGCGDETVRAGRHRHLGLHRVAPHQTARRMDY